MTDPLRDNVRSTDEDPSDQLPADGAPGDGDPGNSDPGNSDPGDGHPGDQLPADLRERAEAAGVATEFEDWKHDTIPVSEESVRRVLDVLEARELPLDAPIAPIPRVPESGRLWGWQIQLYQLISDVSWGIGDYRDLATAARSLAVGGADLILVNPLHALTPVPPGQSVQRSPYFPSSRRFSSALGIAIESLPEYTAAPPEIRAAVDALRPAPAELIDHDAVWAAKRRAFDLLAPRGGAEPPEDTLADFGVFCALAESHGPDWREWPEELRRPGPAATAAADPAVVALHVWVQRSARAQLAAAQKAARASGMRIGLVHDLAVGVDPGGADAWQTQDDLAPGFTIGAPPDSFNQLGQDWGLPPWRPDRLAATDYAPFREVVKATLELGGGLRVDHVMGLFRLWWVPIGLGAAKGTYVSYDGRAMLNVVAEEAAAAGAIVIGEDLGTVSPEVTEALAEAGVLGSGVMWFETAEDGSTLPPAHWREAAAATISTHDLPTAYGQLAGEPARVRHELGQLGHSLEVEQARAKRDLDHLRHRLKAEELLPEASDDPDATVMAMHRLLLATPSRVVLFAPADAVGDLRQPNLPGTTDAYPNWSLPLSAADGRVLGLEGFLGHPGTAHLAAIARAEIK